MGKRTLLTALALVFALSVFCQESDSKRINSIKRNNQYLYAEATMKDAQEAYDTALELLRGYIDEYAQSKRRLESADNLIIRNVETNTQRINMKRGEMTRVFVYVKKSDILPAENPMIMETAPIIEDTEVSPAEVNSISPTEATPDAEVTTEGDVSLKLPIAWQQQVIDELLKCKNLPEAKALLNRMKSEYKIKRCGIRFNCRNKADCFWVVGDPDNNLLTVLGPGSGQRTNFKSLQKDSLENYHNEMDIWFTMSK